MRTFAIGISSVLCLSAVFATGHAFKQVKETQKQANAGLAPGKGSGQRSATTVALEYAKTPLAFEANFGQANPEAKFLSRGQGYEIFLTPKESVFVLKNASGAGASKDQAQKNTSILRMKLIGANSAPVLTSEEQLQGKSNYLLGNKPENWHTNVPNYRKVREHQAYPGIDLVYYGTQGQLEYDFVVGAQRNPAAIRFSMEGADHLRTNADGDLLVGVGGGELKFHKPYAYQQNGSEKVAVAANYVAEGDTVAFQLGNYDSSRALVIDPILSYSTYLGGSNIDGANAIAVASDNTAFIAGGTFSTDFPTAGTHPLQPNHGGPDDSSKDAFVVKLSANGSTVLYATYLGGKNGDEAFGIAVDSFGNAYVTGTTSSPDFPVTFGALNTECGGDGQCGASFNSGGLIVSNAFVSKLNTAGSALVYSTFLGEYENVHGTAIAVDNNQVAYVTGQTEDNFVPSTTASTTASIPIAAAPTGAVENGGGTIATITTTGANGLQINQTVTIAAVTNPASMLVPSAFDGNYSVLSILSPTTFTVLNSSAAPGSSSGAGTVTPGPPPFPITFNAVQLHYGGGATDAYVTAITPTGNEALYSTYLGGSGEDVGYGVAVDASGDAYVTGLSYSPDFPLSASAFQGANGGAGDAFFSKINTNSAVSGAAGLLYSTLLGGAGLDQGNSIAVDASGNAYVAGVSNSLNLGTAGAYQTNCTAPSGNTCEGDAFVAKFNPSATGAASELYFTYVGGSLADSATGVAVDASGDAYITGSTVSTDYPTTADAFQRTYGGGNADAFVTKLDPAGATLLYSSYLGGTNTDVANGIAIDKATPPGAYIAGQTCSQDFPLSNPAQATPGGNCDAFISKVGLLEGIAINPTGLVFAPQTLGTTSQSQTITITSGVAAVNITSISLAGTNSGDFAISANTCGATLAPNSQCAVSVNFTPSAAGNRTGQLSIVDNVSGQAPQSIVASLSGSTSTVPDFSVTTTTPTATVSAGQAATYTLQVTATNAFSQPINLTCQGLPAGASCAISPNPVTPSGSTAVPVTVTISTAVRNMLPPVFHINNYPRMGLYQYWLACLIAFLLMVALARNRQIAHRPVLAGFGLMALLLIGAAGCGGGNSTGVPAGTQAGTYTVTVVATSGSLSHNTTLTLQVK